MALKKIKSLHVCLIGLITLIVELHLLRNVTSLYYILFCFAFLYSVLLTFLRWSLVAETDKIFIKIITGLFLYPLAPLAIAANLGIYAGIDEILIGASRLLFCLPVYLIILVGVQSHQTLNWMLAFSSFFVAIAALSIPYQFIVGPVSWFAESSSRSGIDRFASLLGSLTTLGTVCGYSIIAAAISQKSSIRFSFLIFAISFGSVLSLQKAAIVNLALAAALIPFVRKIRLTSVIALVMTISLASTVAWATFKYQIQSYFLSLRLSAESSAVGGDDVSMIEGAIQRLVELPQIAIDYHGALTLLFGVGPKGGSGAFGYPDVPMSHNGLVDILLIGGAPYALAFLYFAYKLIRVFFQGTFGENRQLGIFGLIILFGIFINLPFSGLLLFQPANSLFIALAVKSISLSADRVRGGFADFRSGSFGPAENNVLNAPGIKR